MIRKMGGKWPSPFLLGNKKLKFQQRYCHNITVLVDKNTCQTHTAGPGCSKLMTSFVKISIFKF